MAPDREQPSADVAVRGGLATLGPEAILLREALDERVLAWADARGARRVQYPTLLEADALDRIGYFQNFPHLAVTAAPIQQEAIERRYLSASRVESVPGSDLEPARHVLPSAACYSAYLELEGQTLEAPRCVTTAANCFRHESSFVGLRRLLGFYMREIICIGDREAVLDHLRDLKRTVLDFVAAIGIAVEVAAASDPFYDASASRSVMQQLFPVKEEVVYDGDLAIASFNYHRNFFGERCDIRLPDGTHAFSGCVAFGLERWIAALSDHFGESTSELRKRVVAAA